MSKTKNIFGIIGILIIVLLLGYLIFTAKELGV